MVGTTGNTEEPYFICHGVYSWVEEQVQDKILAVASRNLSPQGIAYISYNTCPGWHMREAIRHMMLYHTGRLDEPAERVQQARALLDFLAGSVPADSGAYGHLLQSELARIRECDDSYLFHEHLEKVSTPLYFHQFVECAESHGLQYLAESDFASMLAGRFPAEVAETLERISPDIVHLEQYMDFVRNRLFRQTLLCHRGLPLRRALGPAVLHGFLAVSAATPDEPIDLSGGEKRIFRTRSGASIETDAPLTVAAFALMHEHWPCAIDIDELYLMSLQRVAPLVPSTEAEAHRSVLMRDLFQCYLANLIELHTWQAPCFNRVSERPKVSRLAAYQTGNGENPVNQRHEMVNLDPVASELLLALDGSRNRLQLLEYMVQRAKAGALPILGNGEPVTDDRLHEVLIPAIDETLTKLARAALLVSTV